MSRAAPKIAPRLSSEVEEALAGARPVVAFESTIVTHGLAYPGSLEVALAAEQAVRDVGATPASIAVIEGEIRVGLSPEELERLAAAPSGSLRKCSRRDLPVAVGLKETASTTVAGTMVIANMAGIDLFATGGIGGVHRGQPFDVSADLTELGRTPVAVVCAGAKSILDLPLTLEMLETQGVPLIGVGTDDLPAFYAVSSGLPLSASVADAAGGARVLQAWRRLGSGNGLVFAQPVPADQALPAEEAERAIRQATEEAEARGVSGGAVTPFVLDRVAELTEGRAVAANCALYLNNARFAAELAVAAGA